MCPRARLKIRRGRGASVDKRPIASGLIQCGAGRAVGTGLARWRFPRGRMRSCAAPRQPGQCVPRHCPGKQIRARECPAADLDSTLAAYGEHLDCTKRLGLAECVTHVRGMYEGLDLELDAEAP